MSELQPIIVFHSRHSVRHLGICYRICVKLLQLMCAVITHNSVKQRSFHINKRMSYGKIVFHGRHFVRHLGICNPIYVKLLAGYVRCHSEQFKEKTTSLSQTVFLRSTNVAHTHIDTHTRTHARTNTHTHARTHDDSIRQSAMHCISPKNEGQEYLQSGLNFTT